MSGRVVAAIAIVVLGCAYAEIVAQDWVHTRKGPRAASMLTVSALANLVIAAVLGVVSGKPMGYVAAGLAGAALVLAAVTFVRFQSRVKAVRAERSAS